MFGPCSQCNPIPPDGTRSPSRRNPRSSRRLHRRHRKPHQNQSSCRPVEELERLRRRGEVSTVQTDPKREGKDEKPKIRDEARTSRHIQRGSRHQASFP